MVRTAITVQWRENRSMAEIGQKGARGRGRGAGRGSARGRGKTQIVRHADFEIEMAY
jgi:hypothetical protein